MRNTVPLTNGDEVDALDAPHVYRWRPGQRRKIKRGVHKRERRDGKAQTDPRSW